MGTDLIALAELPAVASAGRAQERLLDAFLAGRSVHTMHAYRRDVADFATFLGVPGADLAAQVLVSRAHGDANAIALAYRAHMRERGLSPATINRRLSALRSLVKLANVLGMVSWSLEVDNAKAESYRDTRGPGTDTVKAMIQAAAADRTARGLRDVAILRLLHDLGLRRSEVVGLDLEHVELVGRPRVWILGKGRAQREALTLPAATAKALGRWVEARGSMPGPLLTHIDKHGNARGRLKGDGLYYVVREYGAKVGVSVKVRPHGLRHTAITCVLDRSNGDIRAAQRFSRHKDVRTIARYDDNRQDLAGAMASLIADELGED